MRAVRRFPPASAAGGPGLRPNHLEEMLHVPSPASDSSLLAALKRVINILASGDGPSALAPWIAGAPLTVLSKRDGDIRPIAVGETLRCIVNSCLMSRASSRAATFFHSLQIGIATKSGAETVVHSVRRLYDKFHNNPGYALLSVDLKNAFNLCSRKAFLQGINDRFPMLLPWTEYCYATEDSYLWT